MRLSELVVVVVILWEFLVIFQVSFGGLSELRMYRISSQGLSPPEQHLLREKTGELDCVLFSLHHNLDSGGGL